MSTLDAILLVHSGPIYCWSGNLAYCTWACVRLSRHVGSVTGLAVWPSGLVFVRLWSLLPQIPAVVVCMCPTWVACMDTASSYEWLYALQVVAILAPGHNPPCVPLCLGSWKPAW